MTRINTLDFVGALNEAEPGGRISTGIHGHADSDLRRALLAHASRAQHRTAPEREGCCARLRIGNRPPIRWDGFR
jgi:hypothetical protein